MAWRYHNENIPPILPMYYEYPHQEEAYHCPNQYLFGSELIVAPFITPKDLDTRLSRAVTWLPEGDWFDFFNGQHYTGSSWHAVYGTLSEIPVFARAGAIVPQAPKVAWGGTEAPTHLILNVFPGADGKFDLYDDEGNTNFYLEEAYAITPLAQEWHENQTRLVVGAAQGDLSMVPGQRRFDLLFRGFTQPEQIEVLVNGEPVNFTSTYLGDSYSLSLEGFYLAPTDCLSVTLTARAGDSLSNREDSRLVTCLKLLEHFKMESWAKASLSTVLPDVIQDPAKLGRYLPSLSDSQMRALFEVISGAGLDYTESTGTPLMMVWNNREEERVTHQSALARLHDWWLYPERYPWSSGPLPRFRAVDIKKDYDEGNPWVMEVNYYGVLTVKVGGE
jgi:hypothetical protein